MRVDDARGGLTGRQFAARVGALLVVQVGLATLARMVLGDTAAGVVTAVLTLVGVGVFGAWMNSVRGRRPRQAPRPLPVAALAVPRPPRLSLWAGLNVVVGGAFAVGALFYWVAAVFRWPADLSLSSGDRWTAILLFLPGVAVFVHDIVQGQRELPQSRATVADIVAGCAARHEGQVVRRSLRGLTVAVGPDRVVLAEASWRRRAWDPLPGDEGLLQGDLQERALVLVTTGDGSRWRVVQSVEQPD